MGSSSFHKVSVSWVFRHTLFFLVTLVSLGNPIIRTGFLEQRCPTELSPVMGMFFICLVQYGSHWPHVAMEP